MNRLGKVKKLRKMEKLRWLRILVQILFLLTAPSIYSAAFAAVKNTCIRIGAGKPLEWNAFTLQFCLVILVTILFGRYFCGWACAFGAINDWIYQLSQYIQKKTKKKLPGISEKVSGKLEKLKYVVLVSLLVLCFFQRADMITANSPWTVFSLIRSGRLSLQEYKTGILLLAICILGMCFSERFFCRYLCPMGAVFSLLPTIFLLKRNAENCPAKCGACKRVCPVDLQIGEDTLDMGECIRCGRCRAICPKRNIT